MGNCQAADAATVVIVHPNGNKMDRIYKSVTARHVMNSNPGYYVAVVVTLNVNGLPVKKQLKLLRPHDLLLLGQVYQLICFQDVMKEFAEKKCVKLGKLLNERGVIMLETKETSSFKSHKVHPGGNNDNRSKNKSRVRGRRHLKHQWKPALKSISENEN